MGSYSSLYIGSNEFSWKNYIPDFPCILFEETDFISNLQEEDDEYGDYYEHKFVSDCGKAKALLEKSGINLDLLRKIHFDYFAFDFNSYKEDLLYRCSKYLESKNSEKIADQFKVDKLFRRLLTNFKPLNQSEEFSEVLEVFKSNGDRDEYKNKLEDLLEQQKFNETKTDVDFDMIQFMRGRLTDFMKKNPYRMSHEEDELTSDSSDLDLLYKIGMSIFASDSNNPIEFDFTELVSESQTIIPIEEAGTILSTGRSLLQSRARYLMSAFSNIQIFGSSHSVSVSSKSLIHTSKEKGNLLEDLVTQIFITHPEFKVKKNVRRNGEEIDLVIVNKISDPFWTALQSHTILVECKNQTKKVEPKDLRNFEVKILDRRGLCKLGIIVSISGFTRGCFEVVSKCKRDGINILLIDQKLLQKRIDNELNTADWIEEIILEQC